MIDKEEEKIIDYSPTGKTKSGKKFAILTIILFIITWAAIAALWTYADVNLRGVTNTNDLKFFQTRLDQLEARLIKFGEMVNDDRKIQLTQIPPTLPETGVTHNKTIEIDAVTHSELEIVNERIKLVEKEINELKQLEAEVEKTKNITSQITKGTYGPLVMALSQVQDRVNKGAPYVEELQLVLIESDGDAVLQQHIRILSAHASSGVVTIEQLKDQFKKKAGAIVKEAKKSESKNLWDRTKNELVDMVSIRKVDNVEGDTAEAIVARAEKALERYELTEAVLELDSLDEKPKAIIKDWLQNASNRVAVEYAIDGILKYVTTNVIKNKSN